MDLQTQDTLMEKFEHEMEVEGEGEGEHETMIGSFPHVMENLESKKNVEKTKETETLKGGMIVVFIIAILWMLFGLIAIVMSLVCFGYSGSFVERLLGFLIAIFLGPFYWLYYYFNKGYCGRDRSSRDRSSRGRSRGRSRSRERR